MRVTNCRDNLKPSQPYLGSRASSDSAVRRIRRIQVPGRAERWASFHKRLRPSGRQRVLGQHRQLPRNNDGRVVLVAQATIEPINFNGQVFSNPCFHGNSATDGKSKLRFTAPVKGSIGRNEKWKASIRGTPTSTTSHNHITAWIET